MTNLKLITRDPWGVSSDGLAILVLPDHAFTPGGSSVNEKLKGALKAALRAEAFRVKKGNVATYYAKDKTGRKILFAAFTQKEDRITELRDIAYACAATASYRGMQRLVLAFDPQNDDEVQAIAEGALLATYRYEQFRSKIETKPPVSFIGVCGDKKWSEAVTRAEIFARATMLVRDLVNEPANQLNALKLTQIAQGVAKRSRLQIKLFTAAQMERLGAQAFLSVGKGSKVPNRMIHLVYRPKSKVKVHVALVGKGVTFDSGGLSLKPEKAMEHMKSDMAGAATVLACVQAVKELRLPIAVTGIMMLTENMPGGAASRPGDIVRAMNGKTIEITNTDAEGRLALADGLVYAQRQKPTHLIDVATLTGAQVVGLGRLIGAVMGNDQKLVDGIVSAGHRSGETMWPLPLYKPYGQLIKSDAADMKNSSGIPEAGSIQAGLFLSEFVTHPKWAHLDIAGPSWQEREWSVYPRNASGFGARCLLAFLSALCADAQGQIAQ